MGTIFVTIMIIITLVIFATMILPLITLDPKLHQEQIAMTLILMIRFRIIDFFLIQSQAKIMIMIMIMTMKRWWQKKRW